MAEYGYLVTVPLFAGRPSGEDITKVYRNYVEVRDVLAKRGVRLGPMELVETPNVVGWKAESEE